MAQLKHDYCDSFVSLRAMCHQLGTQPRRLRWLAEHAQQCYRVKPLRKGDKVRELNVPQGELVALQVRIVRDLLNHVPWPDYLHGAMKKRSALTNAKVHSGARYVVRVDVRDFYPSITRRHVFESWRGLGFSPTIARLLTQLTTYRGRLPQGAPTSAAIANLVLLPVERPIVELAERARCKYSRFIDDIAISGRDPHQVVQPLIDAIQGAGFKVRHKKTQVAGKHQKQSLTGYTLNAGKPSRSYEDRTTIGRRITRLWGEDPASEAWQMQRRSIQGSIAHLKQSNPANAQRLERHLERTTIAVWRQRCFT